MAPRWTSRPRTPRRPSPCRHRPRRALPNPERKTDDADVMAVVGDDAGGAGGVNGCDQVRMGLVAIRLGVVTARLVVQRLDVELGILLLGGDAILVRRTRRELALAHAVVRRERAGAP